MLSGLKTFIGAGVAALGAVASLFGYTVTEGDMTQFVENIGNIVTLLGSIYAIYGRVKATKKIGGGGLA